MYDCFYEKKISPPGGDILAVENATVLSVYKRKPKNNPFLL